MERRAEIEHRKVAVDGLSIHVATGGATDNPSLFFLHGWPEDWSSFSRVMRELAADFHVVAIDLPGIGLSDTAAPSGDKKTPWRATCAE